MKDGPRSKTDNANAFDAEVERLYNERLKARIAVNAAQEVLDKAKVALQIAERRYERQQLWARREELSQELAALEDELHKFTIDSEED